MPQFIKMLVVALLLLISGCAHLMMTDAEIIKDIDQNIKSNNYSDAISSIDSLPSNYKKKNVFIIKLKEINKKLSIYENKIIAQAMVFESKKDWKSAGLIYHKAMDNLLEGSSVFEAYKQFDLMQRQQLEKVQLESYVMYARYLMDVIKLRQNVENIFSITEFDAMSLSEAVEESHGLSAKLHEIGVRSLVRQDYTSAIKSIYMAKRLNPKDAAISASMAKLNEKSGEITQYVDTLKKHAASSYGSDSYKIALKLWQEVLMYVPDDKVILANIERVKRVLNSLRQIESKQQ